MPACSRGARRKAAASTMRNGPAPAMPPVWLTVGPHRGGGRSEDAAVAATQRAGERRRQRCEQELPRRELGEVGDDQLTRLFTSSLPVLTNSPIRPPRRFGRPPPGSRRCLGRDPSRPRRRGRTRRGPRRCRQAPPPRPPSGGRPPARWRVRRHLHRHRTVWCRPPAGAAFRGRALAPARALMPAKTSPSGSLRTIPPV